MKKMIAGIALCLLFIPFNATADEKTDLAEKIISLTNMNRMLEQTKEQVLQMESQMMDQFDIPADQKAAAAAFRKKLTEKTFEIMSFDNMHDEYAALFAEVFTLDELKGLVAFYESPVGRSMIEKQPVIIQRAMQITQKRMAVLVPEIQKMAKEFEASLKKE
jgi:hypothetical protein